MGTNPSAHRHASSNKQEKAISDMEKVVDGRSTIVHLKPPLVNVQSRGRAFGAKYLRKNSAKRDASLFDHRGGRPGKRRCGKCGVIVHNRRSCPSVNGSGESHNKSTFEMKYTLTGYARWHSIGDGVWKLENKYRWIGVGAGYRIVW